MISIQRLREQIDACRPGSDDLALAELAELARAAEEDRAVAAALADAQHFDRTVAGALHDVEVPPALVDRLLAVNEAAKKASAENLHPQLLEQAVAECATGSADPGGDDAASLEISGTAAGLRLPTLSRRGWIAAIGSLAGVVLVVATSLVWLRRPVVVAKADLDQAVRGWLSEAGPSASWKKPGSLPAGFSNDRAVRASVRQWRRLSLNEAGWTGEAVALDLGPPGGPRAVLFIVRSPARFEVPATPVNSSPSALSGGWKAVAWQRRDSNLLYVMVIEDRGQRLDEYIRFSTEA